jgi:hypothetical protein
VRDFSRLLHRGFSITVSPSTTPVVLPTLITPATLQIKQLVNHRRWNEIGCVWFDHPEQLLPWLRTAYTCYFDWYRSHQVGC